MTVGLSVEVTVVKLDAILVILQGPRLLNFQLKVSPVNGIGVHVGLIYALQNLRNVSDG